MLAMLVLAPLGLVSACKICLRPVRLVCAKGTGSMLKIVNVIGGSGTDCLTLVREMSR